MLSMAMEPGNPLQGDTCGLVPGRWTVRERPAAVGRAPLFPRPVALPRPSAKRRHRKLSSGVSTLPQQSIVDAFASALHMWTPTAGFSPSVSVSPGDPLTPVMQFTMVKGHTQRRSIPVATFDFRCESHGIVTLTMSIHEVSATAACPTCARPSRRVFTVPQLRLGDSTARRLLDATQRTAYEPEVVSAPSGRGRSPGRRPTADPRTAKLPRP